MRTDKRLSQQPDKKTPSRIHKRGIVGYSKKSALLEDAITQMNSGKYGRSSAALKELLALDPQNIEARRLFATLHLRLGSLVTARQAFESLANEAVGRPGKRFFRARRRIGEIAFSSAGKLRSNTVPSLFAQWSVRRGKPIRGEAKLPCPRMSWTSRASRHSAPCPHKALPA